MAPIVILAKGKSSLAKIPAANACTIAPTCRRAAVSIRQTFLPEDILSSGSHSLEFLTLLQAVAVTFVIIGRGMGDKCINIFCPPHEFPSLSMFLLIPDRSCPVFVPLFGAVLLLALMTPCHFIRCTSFHSTLLIQLPSFCLRPFHFLQHQLWSTVCNQFIPVLSQR